MRRTTLAAAIAALLLALAGCGGDGDGGGDAPKDPVAQVPSGLQEKVRAAQDPQPSEFPQPDGKTLQALADEIGGGPEMGLAGSVFLAGEKNRVAFGVIDSQAGFVYGKTALYYARTPESPAKGPYVAPADVLVTDAPYRSQQAATEADPFAAVYAAEVPFSKPGRYSVMAVTLVNGKPVAAPGQIEVIAKQNDQIPEVGEPAPKVTTDTVASAGGDVEAIDTRRPTSDMHGDFAQDVGKKPVALLFATRSCASRASAARSSTSGSSSVPSTATRWTSSIRRSTPTTTRTRACASRSRSSACARSRGCSWSARTGRSPPGSRAPSG